MSQIKVRDIHGNGLPRINIRISEGDNGSDQAIFDVFTDLAGNTGWPVPHWPPPSSMPNGHYTLHVNDANVDARFEARTVTKSHDNDATVVLSRRPLTRLHVDGHDFVNANGQRVFLKGATGFLFYKRYLDGEDIRPALAQLSELGCNAVRIIGMVSSFSHWYPQEYGSRYYDQIGPFHQLLDSFGLYSYWTVFADTQIVMPDKGQQIDHFNRVVAQLQQCQNSTGELVNEPYAHDNATDDPHAFPRPQGVPFSSGSYDDTYGENPPPGPRWDFHDFHTPRKYPKNVGDQCMALNPNYLQLGMAVLSGEPDKFGRPDPNGKPRNTDPALAKAMAGTARGTACGIFYHTNAGIMSVLMEEAHNELACARAWFAELT